MTSNKQGWLNVITIEKAISDTDYLEIFSQQQKAVPKKINHLDKLLHLQMLHFKFFKHRGTKINKQFNIDSKHQNIIY